MLRKQFNLSFPRIRFLSQSYRENSVYAIYEFEKTPNQVIPQAINDTVIMHKMLQ